MAVETAAVLIESGHQVHVSLPEHGPSVAQFERAGAKVSITPIPIVRKAVLSSPMSLFRHYAQRLGVRRALARVIGDSKPDVVYVNTITQPVWVSAARRAGRPTLVHVREAEWGQPGVVSRALLRHLRRTDLVIANSQNTQLWVQSHTRNLSAQTRVIYNGKDWTDYQRVDDPAPSPGPSFALIGRLSPRKGQDLALEAMARLKRDDIRLTFVGGAFDGYDWYESELRALATSLGLEDRVAFAGFQEDVIPYLQNCTHVLVPSRTEPFGTVALEGMAAGRIVLAAETEGLAEIVHHDQNGFTFSPDDVDSLAAAINYALTAPESVVNRVTQGASATVIEFSRERYASKITSALVEIAESPAS